MATPKTGSKGANTNPSTKVAGKRMTVAEILEARQSEVLEAWLENIRAISGSRTLELMSEEQLRKQTTELLRTFIIALRSGVYDDIERPEFADSIAMLRDISASRARQGFTPSETATFVFSLKDALLHYLQDEFDGNPKLLNAEVAKINKVIDKLSLLTFETFVTTREEVVAQQSRSLLELSTPVVKLWDEILLLPLVGIIDTVRAMQIIERLLQTIVDTESRVVILDVTGVPVIDTAVARHLMQTIAAARLLGTEVVVTGISPEAAQTLVKLNINLSGIRTRGTLRMGVAESLRLLGKQVTSV